MRRAESLAFRRGRLNFGTLVFAGICALALGMIALIFGKKVNQPPEIVEQILYRTEHTTWS
jgi:hypothetical protein